MKDVVVIGAGKIGATVAGLLASTDDYQLTLADRSPQVLDRLDRRDRIRIAVADVEDSSKLVDVLNGSLLWLISLMICVCAIAGIY
jgi:saccharopine dehydrogenase-like NADP-dependent oxidoreductase